MQPPICLILPTVRSFNVLAHTMYFFNKENLEKSPTLWRILPHFNFLFFLLSFFLCACIICTGWNKWEVTSPCLNVHSQIFGSTPVPNSNDHNRTVQKFRSALILMLCQTHYIIQLLSLFVRHKQSLWDVTIIKGTPLL